MDSMRFRGVQEMQLAFEEAGAVHMKLQHPRPGRSKLPKLGAYTAWEVLLGDCEEGRQAVGLGGGGL